jgi:hypothetical protein
MELTTKGVSYPSSDDNIAPLESHFAALAQTADRAGALTGSQAFTGPGATAGVSTVVVAFGKTLKTTPKVVCSVEGNSSSSNYVATIVGPTTTTGFTARVYRLSGSGADSNLKLIWFASDYSA